MTPEKRQNKILVELVECRLFELADAVDADLLKHRIRPQTGRPILLRFGATVLNKHIDQFEDETKEAILKAMEEQVAEFKDQLLTRAALGLLVMCKDEWAAGEIADADAEDSPATDVGEPRPEARRPASPRIATEDSTRKSVDDVMFA